MGWLTGSAPKLQTGVKGRLERAGQASKLGQQMATGTGYYNQLVPDAGEQQAMWRERYRPLDVGFQHATRSLQEGAARRGFVGGVPGAAALLRLQRARSISDAWAEQKRHIAELQRSVRLHGLSLMAGGGAGLPTMTAGKQGALSGLTAIAGGLLGGAPGAAIGGTLGSAFQNY